MDCRCSGAYPQLGQLGEGLPVHGVGEGVRGGGLPVHGVAVHDNCLGLEVGSDSLKVFRCLPSTWRATPRVSLGLLGSDLKSKRVKVDVEGGRSIGGGASDVYGQECVQMSFV